MSLRFHVSLSFHIIFSDTPSNIPSIVDGVLHAMIIPKEAKSIK